MRFLPFFLLLATCFSAVGQQITLSSQVRDAETGEPLSYASVGIKGKSNGTITNTQGDFDFHFPAEYRNEILIISMLGYKNFEAPVWTLLNGQTPVIQLHKASILLNEVVVTAQDSLSGGDLMRIAISRIETNYPMKPFRLDGFYRDIKKVGGTYISLLEAAVNIYDDNYSEPRNKGRLRERVKLLEVRKSLGYDNKFNSYFDQRNLLEDLLLHNNIRYHQFDETDEFFVALERQEDSYYNGHDVYVITHSNDFSLKIFIDKTDYAIIHLEFETSNEGDKLDHKKNLISRFIGYKKTIDFKRYNDKWFLNYITIVTRENWHDEKTRALKFSTELQQSLLINHVLANAIGNIGATERMRNYGLQYQDYPYNKTFWDNYNVIKETPLDKQILADLEKEEPLEKQFEEN